MGRRSINTTKSGKYMNPTDQARKEARKKELKKNKKQRMVVRAAVLKGKDPHQILADMERLDQMEYNVNTPPPLNEKVLRDKRRKLKETWDRLCRLYFKEEHDKFLELKRIETDYDVKRNQLVKFYEAVKSTQDVALDDIPLPSAPMGGPPQEGDSQPGSSSTSDQLNPILKKSFSLSTQYCVNREPPGPPPGPPPILSEFEDEPDEEERSRSKRVRFGEEALEKESDVSEFLKEIEQVEKVNSSKEGELPSKGATLPFGSVTGAMIGPPPVLRPGSMHAPPPLLMLRPHMQSVAGPPSGRHHSGGGGPPPSMPRPSGSVLMPPPARPPLGMQPPRMGPPMNRNLPSGPQGHRPQDRTQPPSQSFPSSQKKDDRKTHFVSDKATIEAKPQLRNLSADSTRFTPVSLRVKRPEKQVKAKPGKVFHEGSESFYSNREHPSSGPTKDDAYDQFMKELQGIM